VDKSNDYRQTNVFENEKHLRMEIPGFYLYIPHAIVYTSQAFHSTTGKFAPFLCVTLNYLNIPV
jgi:hypothetical protein